MSFRRFLVLGGGDGWHADQLRAAAERRRCELRFAPYESLAAAVGDSVESRSEAGLLSGFDALLTRTMPAGTLEQITFRLAILHDHHRNGRTIVNSPRGLEIAIDKFATLGEVARLGYPVPPTEVVQSREEAMEAFVRLGSDCVVKPIFGGEGRGVMRIHDPELAWSVFTTLERLASVSYVQRFVPPGGRDRRLLVIGDEVWGVRRTNERCFRTNSRQGGVPDRFRPSCSESEMARAIAQAIGLDFAAVDLVESDGEPPRVLEVNAIPGWQGAQSVLDVNVAERVIDLLLARAERTEEESDDR